MKIPYAIIGVILSGGLFLSSASCQDKSAVNDKPTTVGLNEPQPKVHQAKDNPFEALRDKAFAATPEQLGLSLPAGQTVVYGIIMDWGMDGATATTVSFQTGDASLYVSSGGGIIGGGQHQSVNDAAKQWVALAQTFLNKATGTKTTPLPEKDAVKFYLLTNKGVYVGQEQIKNFENNSSSWLDLFKEGNKVLTALREVSPD